MAAGQACVRNGGKTMAIVYGMLGAQASRITRWGMGGGKVQAAGARAGIVMWRARAMQEGVRRNAARRTARQARACRR